jgi:MraZ protein
MASFSSKFTAIVDGKGRIVLPAPFKKEMGDALETVFVVEKDPYDRCLNIYPQSSWQAKVERIIKRLNMDDQIQGMMLSRIYEEIATVHMAENGRLNIPDEMLQHAGITKEAIFTGQGSRMRLWEPSRHKASRLSDEEYARLYKELLGGPVNNF